MLELKSSVEKLGDAMVTQMQEQAQNKAQTQVSAQQPEETVSATELQNVKNQVVVNKTEVDDIKKDMNEYKKTIND